MFTPMNNPNTFSALAFLSGASPDREGRFVGEYFDFDAAKWEACHNHIQWAFPSSVPSIFNANAPIIDFDEFLRHTYIDGFPVSEYTEVIYETIGGLIERYVDSLGIGITVSGTPYLMKQHPERLGWSQNPNDHNHRRLTRLFMLWHHLKEPLEAYDKSYVGHHFDSLYYFISTTLSTELESDASETLRYWHSAFHTGKN